MVSHLLVGGFAASSRKHPLETRAMGLIRAYPVLVELSFLAIDYLDVSQLSAPVCSQPPLGLTIFLPFLKPALLFAAS